MTSGVTVIDKRQYLADTEPKERLSDRKVPSPAKDPLSRLVDARTFDLILANPPYIAKSQIPQLDRSVREYEPSRALDGGIDGLQLHRRILQEAPARLSDCGRIFLEIAFDQGPSALEMIHSQADAFDEVRIIRDHGGRDRVLAAR